MAEIGTEAKRDFIITWERAIDKKTGQQILQRICSDPEEKKRTVFENSNGTTTIDINGLGDTTVDFIYNTISFRIKDLNQF